MSDDAVDGSRSPRIRVHRSWFENPASLASRLQYLVIGEPIGDDPAVDRENTDVPRWHIDPSGNNWWLHLHPETFEFHLFCRYDKTAKEWNALKTVIEMLIK